MASASKSNDGPEPMAIDTPGINLKLAPEEEESLAVKRLENDERTLRRIPKKFAEYAAALQASRDQSTSRNGKTNGGGTTGDTSVQPLDDLRQAMHVELGAFLLLMQKSALMVQAEKMQAQEYASNTERILQEHEETRDEIARLKIELQEAELFRERKKEYDVIAAKINTLPPRSELNEAILELEDEIAVIQAEQEATREVLVAKRTMMEEIRQRIQEMILHGKDGEPSRSGSPVNGANAEGSSDGVTKEDPSIRLTLTPAADDGLNEAHKTPLRSGTPLNPEARPFQPSSLRPQPSSPAKPSNLLNSSQGSGNKPGTPLSGAVEEPEDGEDVEMGEVSESSQVRHKKKTAKEDLEEGEASDASSELSSLPD